MSFLEDVQIFKATAEVTQECIDAKPDGSTAPYMVRAYDAVTGIPSELGESLTTITTVELLLENDQTDTPVPTASADASGGVISDEHFFASTITTLFTESCTGMTTLDAHSLKQGEQLAFEERIFPIHYDPYELSLIHI